MHLEDTVAVVTGGGSGLGAATARSLAGAGAHVVVLDISEDAADEVAREIDGTAVIADITDEASAMSALDVACGRGPLRALVNCAGIATAGRIAGRDGPLPLEVFERTVRVNLVGTFNMMRLAVERMLELGALADGERGAIVNTASVAAFDGQLGQVAYAASKGGVAAMALPAARELARFGIRVNTIAPGLFRTPMLSVLPEEAQEKIASDIPFPQRLGDPDEFARAALFCLENAYMNAEVIRLDGGLRLPPK